jgi:hypothetical protein
MFFRRLSNSSMSRFAVRSGIFECVYKPSYDRKHTTLEMYQATILEAVLAAVHIDGGDAALDHVMHHIGYLKMPSIFAETDVASISSKDATGSSEPARKPLDAREDSMESSEASPDLADFGEIEPDGAKLTQQGLEEETGMAGNKDKLRVGISEATADVVVTKSDQSGTPELSSSTFQHSIDSNGAEVPEAGQDAWKLEDIYLENVRRTESLLGFKFKRDNIPHVAAALHGSDVTPWVHGKPIRKKQPLVSHGFYIMMGYLWRRWLARQRHRSK